MKAQAERRCPRCQKVDMAMLQNRVSHHSDDTTKQGKSLALQESALCIAAICSGESNRPPTPILLKSIAIHLPFLSRYFCLLADSSIYTTKSHHDTPPICIAILFQKVLGSGVVGTPPICVAAMWCTKVKYFLFGMIFGMLRSP